MSLRNILIPIDFSPYSQRALETAFELGESFGTSLHLVHVIDGKSDDTADRAAMEQLVAFVLPSYEVKCQVIRKVVHGSIHEELIKYANTIQADLIVMGTRGRTGILHFALGSVAHRVLRSSPCPVTLIGENAKRDESTADPSDTKYLQARVSDSPALDLVSRAMSMRATDIHIDPSDDEQYQVRFRIDGVVVPYCMLDRNVSEHLINQYMTLARIDRAEPFRPREGRLQLPPAMKDIEIRITQAPVAGGEAIALRLFAKSNVFLPLDQLGFSEHGLATVRSMLHGNEGLILVTGPTGSGKTTTLYSMLETFGGQHRNIVSIEDPVEFSVPSIRQLSVDERHDVTMTSGLRTILRMDPDIVFIGEIRDPENAGIAFRAASSGRFVFSSLHTRDVASTITALRDLDISDHSLAGNLAGVLNQRLVRTLCRHCRKAVPLSTECREAFEESGLSIPNEVYDPSGCDKCRGTGFYGRCGVYEAVVCRGEIADAISAYATEAEIRRLIRTQTASLTSESMSKVASGITSFGEAQSVRWL